MGSTFLRWSLAVWIVWCGRALWCAAAESIDPWRADTLERFNKVRAQQQLPPLAYNVRLAAAAQAHAQRMAAVGKLAHDGIGNGDVRVRADNVDYAWKKLGENILWGADSPAKAVQQWMDSPPHRGHILGDYQDVGMGRATAADGKIYWCAVFGSQ